MRIFAGVMSIEAAIIGFLSWYYFRPQSGAHLFLIPEDLAKNTGLILSVVMFIAGVFVIAACRNDFFLFLAMVLWVFGIILGLMFSPSFSGIYFRPVVCFLCLIIGLFIFTDFNRKKK